ncbi:MAG TPA: helical backbone metal receptor [bacterium]|nr:helical backbone metal receptor [bacterium]
MIYSDLKKGLLSSLLLLLVNTGQAERLVSLGTYPTQNLLLLDLVEELVGVTIHEPLEIRQGREIIGTLWEPNVEKILSLRPDVVIASKEGNRPQSVNKLKELHLEVLLLEEVRTFQDACDNLLSIGRRFQRRKQAEEMVHQMKAELETLRRHRPQRKPTVFFCLGLKPLVTAGRDSFIHRMIEDAGGENLFGTMAGKYLTISLEEAVRRNPEVIITLEMEAQADPDFWKRYPGLKAVKSSRVFMVSNELFANPTPRQYLLAVRYLRQLLFPGRERAGR